MSVSSFLICSYECEVHRDVSKREHPQIIRPLLPEIEAFAKHNHLNVLHPVLRLVFYY
jgi:hypothetical protein